MQCRLGHLEISLCFVCLCFAFVDFEKAFDRIQKKCKAKHRLEVEELLAYGNV